MLLIAIRQLCGDYGVVAPGARFECSPRDAESLMSRGLARLDIASAIEAAIPQYETKVVAPAENKAAPPATPPAVVQPVIVVAATTEQPRREHSRPRGRRR